jgi:hypothetical protein
VSRKAWRSKAARWTTSRSWRRWFVGGRRGERGEKQAVGDIICVWRKILSFLLLRLLLLLYRLAAERCGIGFDGTKNIVMIILPLSHLRQREVPHSLIHGTDIKVLEGESRSQPLMNPSYMLETRKETPACRSFSLRLLSPVLPRPGQRDRLLFFPSKQAKGIDPKWEILGVGFFSPQRQISALEKTRERIRRDEKLFSHSPTHRRRDLRTIGIFPLGTDPPGERERERSTARQCKSRRPVRGEHGRNSSPRTECLRFHEGGRIVVGTHTRTPPPRFPFGLRRQGICWVEDERWISLWLRQLLLSSS